MSMALQLQEREEIGKEIGKEIGAFAEKVSTVRCGKGDVTEEQVIRILRIDRETYDKISDMIENNPDMSDWEIAETILQRTKNNATRKI